MDARTRFLSAGGTPDLTIRPGPTGPPGPAVGPGEIRTAEVVQTVANDADDEDTWNTVAVATCPDGQIAISGGYDHFVSSLGEVYSSTRYEDPDDDIDGSSWIVEGVNWADPEADEPEGTLTAIAQCVPGPTADTAPYAVRHAAALRYAEKLKARAASVKRR